MVLWSFCSQRMTSDAFGCVYEKPFFTTGFGADVFAYFYAQNFRTRFPPQIHSLLHKNAWWKNIRQTRTSPEAPRVMWQT